MIAIDGWVASERSGECSLHLDVTFDEARLGGTEDAEVRFRVRIRSCTVVVIIPDAHKLAVQRGSVDREIPLQARLRRVAEHGEMHGLGKEVAEFVKAGSIEYEALVRERGLDPATQNSIPVVTASHRAMPNGSHSWKLKPSFGQHLEGKVWNPNDEPRMKINDLRSREEREADEKNGLSPVVLIEILCKREDIDIYDIRMNDDVMQAELEEGKNHAVRRAAAEGFIRSQLMQQGLTVGDMAKVFSDLTVADFVMPVEY
ncbi:hypothetical protein [uncultured Roseobacter sp.]|uniref:hypothetical protein n=1 Tax=uncultured Roseobacter sp. TaxID=114847 RepID=UPI00260A3C7E|nr:hypothetical protein [uncultured Roseobacter sp.]